MYLVVDRIRKVVREVISMAFHRTNHTLHTMTLWNSHSWLHLWGVR